MTCPQRSWETIWRGCRLRRGRRGGNRARSRRSTLRLGHWFFTATSLVSFDSSSPLKINHLRSGKTPTLPASPKPENDLDLGRVAPTCGTKFGREIGAAGAPLLATGSCTPASVVADRLGSLRGEVPVGSVLGFGLVSFALLDGGTPRTGPPAAGAAELLRIGAGTVAARMGDVGVIDGGAVTPG